MANIELARKALDYIAKYPEHHYQGEWCRGSGGEFPAAIDNGDHPPCGTTLCMAGWVSFLAAPKGTKFIAGSSGVYLPAGHPRSMASFAEEALDIDSSQASALFYRAGDLAELTAMVDHLKTYPGAVFDELLEAACLLGNDEYSEYDGD